MRLSIIIIISMIGLFPIYLSGSEPPPQSPIASPLIIDNDTRIDANNLELMLTNRGSFARDLTNNARAGLWYPRGAETTVMYAAGIWVGAKVNDQVRVTVADYSYEYVPGPYGSDPADPVNRVFKISRGDTTSIDYLDWPIDQGAPYHDLNQNWRHDPGEQPFCPGEQTLFTVFNDGDPSVHTNEAGRTPPLGIEVQMTTYAHYATGIDQTIFIKYKLINKGTDHLDSTYVRLWSDADLGYGGDDNVGCYPGLNVGYCYNSSPTDLQYLGEPPAVGIAQLQGPMIPDDSADPPYHVRLPDGRYFENHRLLPMISFLMYFHADEPYNAYESYSHMQGRPLWRQIINPITGEETTFMMDGDPLTGDGWIDFYGGERQMAQSTGPFDLPPWQDTDSDGEPELGEPGVQELVYAVIVGQGPDHLSSVRNLFYRTQFAADFYWNRYEALTPPPVTTVGQDRQVVLYWDDDAERRSGLPYLFEGYNVYQFSTPDDPEPRKIATFDLVNNVGVITQPEYVDGVYIQQVAQTGSDSGLRRSLAITRDLVNDTELLNNQTYYYAVSAYYFNPDDNAFLKTVETPLPPEPIAVTPHLLSSDVISLYDYGDLITTTHVQGQSEARVKIEVIDPTLITGHTYELIFATLTDSLRCNEWFHSVPQPATCLVWQCNDITRQAFVTDPQRVRRPADPDSANYLEFMFDGLLAQVIDSPDLTPPHPLTTDDRYEFQTVAPARDSLATPRILQHIKVVPNPIFVLNGEDQQIVRFTHLPTKCTIRIFNLAGDRVRILKKDDPTNSALEWDLINDHNWFVGSGIYIWHVDSEFGTATGRIAIFR